MKVTRVTFTVDLDLDEDNGLDSIEYAMRLQALLNNEYPTARPVVLIGYDTERVVDTSDDALTS